MSFTFVRSHIARKQHECLARHPIAPGERYVVVVELPSEWHYTYPDGDVDGDTTPFGVSKMCTTHFDESEGFA